jgi:hypothetical protein
LFSLTTGSGNTAIGFDALYSNTTGSYNVANGDSALLSNTSGFQNVADGASALNANTTGYYNTAVGSVALLSNTTGHENTALGSFALESNTIGIDNVAIGGALVFNTSGSYNVASGDGALHQNTTGDNNVANGSYALYSNTTGHENTANGLQALYSNTTGVSNAANGANALYYNTTGSNNVALGFNAGLNLTAGDNNIDIGNEGVAGESNTIRIGTQGTQTATFIAGIRGVPITGGQAVGVNASGQLGIRASSAQFKEAIKPMGKASEAILALKPVTFRYKQELDPKGSPQFGLIAEEVAKVNPNLVVTDDQGKPFTVRYDEVNAMLLNEFLKEHRKNEKQESTIAELKAELATLSAAVRKQGGRSPEGERHYASTAIASNNR